MDSAIPVPKLTINYWQDISVLAVDCKYNIKNGKLETWFVFDRASSMYVN